MGQSSMDMEILFPETKYFILFDMRDHIPNKLCVIPLSG
jgi:hypothetical protein